jgi:hypothetical protein
MLGVTPSRSDRRFGLLAGRQARTPFLPWRNWPPAATRLAGQPCPNRARPTGKRNALSLTYYPQPDRLEALPESGNGQRPAWPKPGKANLPAQRASLTYYPQPDRLEALHETKKGNQLPGCSCAVWLGLALALWSWTLA